MIKKKNLSGKAIHLTIAVPSQLNASKSNPILQDVEEAAIEVEEDHTYIISHPGKKVKDGKKNSNLILPSYKERRGVYKYALFIEPPYAMSVLFPPSHRLTRPSTHQ